MMWEEYSILKNHQIIEGYSNNAVSSLIIDFDDCNIWSVKTIEEYRRKGYCYELLKFVLSCNNEWFLFVYPDNESAIQLYKKLGFTFIEHEPNDYGSIKMVYKKK